MDLKLDSGTAAVVAGSHDVAASTIDESAANAPASIDGGAASAYLSEIIGAVAQTASEIALINSAVADLVTDVADDYGQTEDVIGAEFCAISKALP